MRTRALAVVLAAVGGFQALAQDPMQPSGPPTGGPGGGGGAGERMRPMHDAMKKKFLESLPPEARQRFESAREKALKDPQIQELREKSERGNREFFEAMRRKMQEIDPGLAELIKDYAPRKGGDGPPKGEKEDRPPKEEAGTEMMDAPKTETEMDAAPAREKDKAEASKDKKGMKEARHGAGPSPAGMAALTDAQRAQLEAARAKAKSDPAVVEAQKQKDGAKTPDERRAAAEAYRAAMRAATLKVDPSLEPIVSKLGVPPPPVSVPPPSIPRAEIQTDMKPE